MRGKKLNFVIALALLSAFFCTRPAAPQTSSEKIEGKVLSDIRRDRTVTFFVVLGEQADLRQAVGIRDWKNRGEAVVNSLRETAGRTQTPLLNFLSGFNAEVTPFWIVNTIKVTTSDEQLIHRLAALPSVALIKADKIWQLPEPTPSAQEPTIQSVEWGISRVHAPDVWSQFGARGQGIVVASIDTGVQFDHPALVLQYRGRKADGTFDHNYNWYDPSYICGNPSLAPCDNNGHGTHTMGTAVGDDGGSNQIGVAPGARWITAKGCESTSCSSSGLLSSGQWILAPTDLNGQNPRPDLRPNIVNNSWAGDSATDPFYRSTVQAWINAGIFPAFAIGNSGPSCSTADAPGSYPESFGAGATDIFDNIASFSARGPVNGFGGIVKPNVSAPGVSIRSSVPTNSYASFSGTSMATPHVSGVVALLWSANPALIGNIAATEDLLQHNADFRSSTQCGSAGPPNNVYGWGIVNALAAVQSSLPTHTLTVASSNPSSAVSITVSPNDKNGQGNGATQFTRTYDNNAGVTLTATSTAGANNFTSWSGCDSSSGITCNVTMNADKTVTALYVTPRRTLTVASSNPASGVSITVSPNDNGGQGNGATQFTRTYDNNAAVALTAPAIAGGNNFSSWSGCDSVSGNICNVTMNADKAVTAVYVNLIVSLTYNGQSQDRVGQNNLSQGTDGHLDSTFTVSFPAGGGTRTVTSLRLDGNNTGGVWDTNGATGFWTLGVARDVGSVSLNGSNDSVNFSVVPGGSFVIFASDWFLGQPFPNGLFQPGNTFTLTMGFSDGSTATPTMTIPIPIQLPTVTIAATTPNAAEGGASGAFTVTRTGSTTSALTVNYTVGGTAVAGINYTALSGTVVIPVNSSTAVITVTPVENALVEGDKTVLVTLSSNAAYTVGSSSNATVTIEDNDGSITLTFDGQSQDRVGQNNLSQGTDGHLDSTFTVSFPAGGGTRTVTSLRLDGNNTGGVWDTNGATGFWTLGVAHDVGSVSLNGSNDSVNFSVVPGGSFVIFASDWFLGQPFPNGLFQPGNTFTLTMGFSDGSTAAPTMTIPISIQLPTVTIAATTPNAAEGGASGAFTVTRTGSTTSALTVNYTVGGTAVAGTNYTALSGAVVIPVNSSTAVITVTPVENALVEGDKTVLVTLSSNAAYTVGSSSNATVTIEDNDGSITLTFDGQSQDRVGQNNLSQGTDGHLDSTFTVSFPAGGGTRTVTSLRLDGNNTGGVWDTNGATGFWTLGVAHDVGSVSLNGSNDSVNFSVVPGGSFVIFASDWFLGQPFPNGLFQPGNTFTLTMGFSDGSTAAPTMTIP